jgi:(6-4)DNA photolyase
MTRWLFGDQLGPHFLDHSEQPVVLVESRGVFRRRRFHRQKAHLVLSAMRHRAAELGDQCRYLRADTYAEALDGIASTDRPDRAADPSGPTLTVCHLSGLAPVVLGYAPVAQLALNRLVQP